MGTLYMVFHSVLQFWPGSAEAVPAATTGMVMSATPIPTAVMTILNFVIAVSAHQITTSASSPP